MSDDQQQAPIADPAQPAQPAQPRIPAGVPAIYADHIADAVYGFHTTKLVLAIEQGISPGIVAMPENLRPVAVLTMPTPLLFAAALKIVTDMTERNMVDQTAERFRMILEQLEGVGSLLRRPDGAPDAAETSSRGAPADGPDGG